MRHLALLITTGLAYLSGSALAKTDIAGCTSYVSIVNGGSSTYNTVIWFVPDTLEICEFLDCGGGRAPPKTTVPGCPLYSGTATVTPKFLSENPLAPKKTSSAVVTTSTEAGSSSTAAGSSPTTTAGSESSSIITSPPSMSTAVTGTGITTVQSGSSNSTSSTRSAVAPGSAAPGSAVANLLSVVVAGVAAVAGVLAV